MWRAGQTSKIPKRSWADESGIGTFTTCGPMGPWSAFRRLADSSCLMPRQPSLTRARVSAKFLTLDQLDPPFALDVHEPQRPAAAPVAGAMPSGCAGYNGTGAGQGRDPCRRIHGIAPQV